MAAIPVPTVSTTLRGTLRGIALAGTITKESMISHVGLGIDELIQEIESARAGSPDRRSVAHRAARRQVDPTTGRSRAFWPTLAEEAPSHRPEQCRRATY